MGRNRADVVGVKKSAVPWLFDPSVIAIELKNELSQLKRGIDQMTTFQDYAHQVYMACTPVLAHDYLRWHASSIGVQRWDPHCLRRKMEKIRAGLLIVEGATVTEMLVAGSGNVDASKLKEVMDQVERKQPVA